jgi:hypothetical protein
MKCGCHPNCGIGATMMISKHTKEWAPVTQFLDADRLLDDVKRIVDAGRKPAMTKVLAALSLLRNYKPFRAPKGLTLSALVKKFDKQSGERWVVSARPPMATRRATSGCCCSSPACGSRISGRTTSAAPRCASFLTPRRRRDLFCAYNTGVGWRPVVEQMHHNASVAEWYKRTASTVSSRIHGSRFRSATSRLRR